MMDMDYRRVLCALFLLLSPAAPVIAVDAPAAGGINLALNQPATASSAHWKSQTADAAVDGDATSRWQSDFTDAEWLQVDLGGVYTIDQVSLHWARAYALIYEVLISTDGLDWQLVYRRTESEGGQEGISFPPVSARHIRIQGIQRGTNKGYSLLELAVYGVQGSAVSGVTLSWLPPTENTDESALTNLAGYNLYAWMSQESSEIVVREERLDNPGITSYFFDGLTAGTWYFTATAFNTQGMESAPAEVVTRYIP